MPILLILEVVHLSFVCWIVWFKQRFECYCATGTETQWQRHNSSSR